jgi:serine/threonine protein kinase
LHDNNVLYRDLKPENVLLDLYGHVQLADFGLSKEIEFRDALTTTVCGSPEYMAPELLRNQPYGRAVDWWTLGVLLYEMLTGLPPWYNENHAIMHRDILSETPLIFDTTYHLSEDVRSMCHQLLSIDPRGRLGGGPGGLESVKRHSWLRNVDWDAVYNRRTNPPLRPHVRHSLDVQNFSHEFTSETARDSPCTTPLQNSAEKLFDGFSYCSATELRRRAHSPPMSPLNSPVKPLGRPHPPAARSGSPAVRQRDLRSSGGGSAGLRASSSLIRTSSSTTLFPNADVSAAAAASGIPSSTSASALRMTNEGSFNSLADSGSLRSSPLNSAQQSPNSGSLPEGGIFQMKG